MATAIIGICAALIPFIIWLVKRQITNDSDPKLIRAKYEEETRKLIAAKDAAGVNRFVDERLRELSRNSSGQGNRENQSRGEGK
jgi:hypothetical protein